MNNATLTRLGALLLALSLIGYAIYELVLLPAAGFPSDDMRVIIAGADTLRVGHWLKFGYGLAIGVVVAGMTSQLREASPSLTQLALIAGIATVTLYIASGMLGPLLMIVYAVVLAVVPMHKSTTRQIAMQR